MPFAQAIWKDYSPTHFGGQTGTYTGIEESIQGVPARPRCDPATVGEFWCVYGGLAEQRSVQGERKTTCESMEVSMCLRVDCCCAGTAIGSRSSLQSVESPAAISRCCRSLTCPFSATTRTTAPLGAAASRTALTVAISARMWWMFGQQCCTTCCAPRDAAMCVTGVRRLGGCHCQHSQAVKRTQCSGCWYLN